jgi:pimeloyl-ACP methyl ester carboxylesterase
MLEPALVRGRDRAEDGEGLSVTTRDATPGGRSPVLPIAASVVVGLLLAVGLVVGPASGGSEATVTGSGLLAFGLGWALMWFLTRRFSSQPQDWAKVPAAILGLTGLALIVLQPGPRVMDLLSWLWPIALAILVVWMVLALRRQLRGRGRWLVVPLIVVLAIFAIGGGVTTVTSALGTTDGAGAGQMVDVGGHRLYIECQGSGAPVVILQSGLGESSSYWSRIASTVATTTRVCAYDRAGHGRSDEVGPQDGIAVANDLHTLLEQAGVPGPYVLVGHSSGGPYVRVFATRYPDQVAGVVLLDAQPADAFTALPDYPGTYSALRTTYGLGPSLARIGVLGPLLGVPADEATVAVARAPRDEIVSLPATLQEAEALTSFGDRPLIVVTAGVDPQRGWLEAQDAMAGLSTNSAHRVIDNSTHISLITGEHASASTQAILDVLTSIRDGTSLE